jgi:UPF0042 nucleotide-binding protein
MLDGVRQAADLLIDTSYLSVPQLRRHIMSLLGSRVVSVGRLNVVLTSFGFKHGVPPEGDLLFDVRFLPNPQYVEALAPLTGLSPKIQSYVFSHLVSRRLLRKLADFLTFVIPHYVEEGKSHLTIGIGCTGGQHRSVAIVERLARTLNRLSVNIIKAHRDIERDRPARSQAA